jgi:hypothetical protein
MVAFDQLLPMLSPASAALEGRVRTAAAEPIY